MDSSDGDGMYTDLSSDHLHGNKTRPVYKRKHPSSLVKSRARTVVSRDLLKYKQIKAFSRECMFQHEFVCHEFQHKFVCHEFHLSFNNNNTREE